MESNVRIEDRQLPRRVRELLQGIRNLLRGELQHQLTNTLAEFENQVFRMAEQARSPSVQGQLMVVVREVRQNSAQITDRFMAAFESSLATIRDPAKPVVENDAFTAKLGELSLVEESEIDERILLQEIGGRAEVRNSLVLFLLGQRFGVLAGKPAFDAESMPVGPNALCDMALQAIAPLGWVVEYRHLFLRQFDKQVVQYCATHYEALNHWFVKQGVLPHLRYIPLRQRGAPKPVQQAAGAAQASREGSAEDDPSRADGLPGFELVESLGSGAGGGAAPGPAAALPGGQVPPGSGPAPQRASFQPTGVADSFVPQPHTVWPGGPSAMDMPPQGGAAEEFDDLRGLLAGRRALMGKLTGKAGRSDGRTAVRATRGDLTTVLDRLQRLQAAPVMKNGKASARTVANLKQDLLMQLRVGQPDGAAVDLDEEADDTIELIGLLLDHITKAINPSAAATQLLTQLQVPLLRIALEDKSFFTRTDHPARQLLNSVAETSAWFRAEDPADKAVLDRMRSLVDKVVSDFEGDTSIFEGMLSDLSEHLQVQVRRAELAEKRHVEAARGKEKLELARHQASDAVDAIIGTRTVPKFLSQLLQVAWADVLALSLLRHGAESEVHQHHVEIAERLVDAASEGGRALSDPAERSTLTDEIEHGLALVGYDAGEARDVAARLLAAASRDERDDPATRTELAVRLKKRTRFGQDIAAAGAPVVAPLNDEEQEAMERIKRLPFGTWFEWKEENGEFARKRMSWFSPVTHHALFVNHRGQRIGEFTLEFLAREIVGKRLRVLMKEQGSLVDRAWRSIVGALRSFGHRAEGAPA